MRTRRKPETTEIPTQADMRDLRDLATVKGIRRHSDWLRRAGIIPFTAARPPDADAVLFLSRS